MIATTVTHNLSDFEKAFGRYIGYTRKSPQEALERKVKNINIKIFQGFRASEWSGYPRQKGIGMSELKSRTAAGKGTKVRGRLMDEYKLQRGLLGLEAKSALGKKHHAAVAANLRTGFGNLAKSLWQSFVGKEVKTRQGGIGVLAASFLAFRKRSNNARGVFYVLNKQKRGMGYVDVEEGRATIASLVPGVVEVNNRYGIVAKAIAAETKDTLDWMQKQDAENKRKAGL